MQIQEIMTAALERIEADATVAEAAMLMDKHDVGCLAVVDNGAIVGILTDRDIVIRAIAAGKDPKNIDVRETMTTDPVFCRTDDEVPTVAQRMEEKKIRRVIVRDENEIPVGMVSLGDIAARAHETALTGDVMEEVCSKG